MTDNQVTEDVTVETIPTPPAEAGFSLPEGQVAETTEGAAPERDWEADAREMGWVPETEFRGDKKPAKFLSAKEFVERGETVLPFVQRENKRLREEREKKDREFQERIDRLTKATEATLKAQREQHAKELAELTAKRDAAVEAGNIQEFRRLDRQITDHQAKAPEAPEEEAKPATGDDPIAKAKAAEAAWIDTHKDWYGKDAVMTGYAQYVSQGFLAQNPNITMEENLRLTEEAVRQQFPMKFGKATGANAHAPVDSGGDPKPADNGSKTPLFDKLPKEAKALAEQAVKDGIYKSKEDWARVYNS